MASDDTPEQSSKTEDPSQKKLEDAHKRGDVVKSQEVTTWFMLGGSGLVILLLGPWIGSSLTAPLGLLMANADQYEVGGPAFGSFFMGLAGGIALATLLPLFALTLFAVAANLVQHRPVLSLDPITPRLSKISPIEGFKRLFSVEALVNFAKGLVKIAVVGGVLFFVLWPERGRLDTMMTADPGAILAFCEELGVRLFVPVMVVVTVIAVADYLFQRQRWWNRHRMTVQEVRDEYKQMEGDPQIKARIRRIRSERSRKRMMSAVPEATVVVTNPTHFAVALKYNNAMSAPVCVAKGADRVALNIRRVAEDNDVPIIENPPLARALFASVEVDDTIPTEHYKAVAQVIGYVMRLRERPRWRA